MSAGTTKLLHRSTGTVVALHGHGDHPDGAALWARDLAPAGWSVRVPEAPLDASGQRSWFDSGPRGARPEELQRSLDAVGEVVRSAARSGPVVVAGFSQGAALALALPAQSGLEAVVSLCGFLPEADGVDPAAGPPALLLGAEDDEVVPAFLSGDAAAAMASAGRDVQHVTVAGGHEVSGVALAEARRWIEQRATRRLRVSIALPTDRVGAGAEFVSGAAIAELAGGFERLGFEALYVTDHPAPDDRWLAAGGHHALEPTVALATAAAATSRILLHTHVYVLGYRNPFLAAKALASLDVVSGGRLVLGVAAGYLRAEFEALGADFEDRGEHLDESLDLVKRIWLGSSVTTHGPGYSARSTTALPSPFQSPHPPIWVGGNSRAAMRRAITRGQGWAPFPTPGGLARATRTASVADLDELSARLADFDLMCEEHSSGPRPTVCFTPFSLAGYLADPDRGTAELCEEAGRLLGLGVDWITVSVPGDSRAELLDRAEALRGALGAHLT